MYIYFTDTPLESMCDPLQRNILGVIYGHAIGDAIGLLTEFISKAEAQKVGISYLLLLTSFIAYLPTCLRANLPTCLPTYLPTCLHACLHTH